MLDNVCKDGARSVSKMKKTEIGVIPEDWVPHIVDDVIKFSGGSQPPLYTFSPVSKSDYVRLIQIRDYKTDKYKVYIPENLGRKFCTKDDIMIGRYGPPIFQILKGIEGAYNVALLKAIPNEELINKRFAWHFLKSETLFNFVDKLSQRSSGQTGVDLIELRNYPIPLPPLAEQEAIASALSDADAWIDSLEQLIAKKRLIKQGAMQTLLTPKEDWEVKKLGDYVKFQTGFPFSSEFFNTKMIGERLIKNRDLRSDDSIFYYAGVFKKDFIVNNGDLLIGMDGDFEPVLWKKGKALLNQRVGRVLKLKEISIQYLAYSLIDKLKEIEESTGSTTVKHLSHSDIENLEYKIPSLSEQERIATILSDMDAELEALETQLGKARQIKQGMMQELLTGRTRLV